MICKLFTVIVFIAELIICFLLLSRLIKFDNYLINLDKTLDSLKPSIKDIGYLVKKISAQYVEFAEDFVYKFTKKKDEFAIRQLNKILLAIILLKINSKFIKKLRRSKLLKGISKVLSLFQLVV